MKRIINTIIKRSTTTTTYNPNWPKVNNHVDTVLYNSANFMLEDIYMNLPYPEEIVAIEYVWHGSKRELRNKTKIIEIDPDHEVDLDDCPEWSYDGSSTGQARGGNSDVFIIPKAIFKDPFRRGRNVIVLCETFDDNGKPLDDNYRNECEKVHNLSEVKEEEFIYAFEQEYILTQNSVPVGWPENGEFPSYPQGPYYCGCGTENVVARNFVESHMRACLFAGIAFAGINAEVMLGQWEYQIGPLDGVSIGDHLEMSRYFLHRIGEQMNLGVVLHPKPVSERNELGGWNGSGNHCNCSSVRMRESGGMSYILEAIKKLESNHENHVKVYGENNEMRLSGKYETQHIDQFSFGVADRGSSIRINKSVWDDGFGWFEDRRPSANCDPYLVTSRIAKTLCEIEKKPNIKMEYQNEIFFNSHERVNKKNISIV